MAMGEHDELENRYAPRFEVLLSDSGVVVEYRRDRAGIDTGLHLFAREDRDTGAGTSRPYWRPLASRVWFQLKGVHASTMTRDDFAQSDRVAVKVALDHLRFWYAAPEPVYLVAWVESVDTFVGIDVRELVRRRWAEGFYAETRGRDGDIVVHIPTASVMNAERISALVSHRSMRIDGPAFRGRPLGHHMDPLRSEVAPPEPATWAQMVWRLLQAHDFREISRQEHGDLVVARGVLAQTMLWQSPAFAEYGYSFPGEVRDEPAPEMAFGDVTVILDTVNGRRAGLSPTEAAVLEGAISDAADDGSNSRPTLLVFFRDRDLSGAGGVWRSAARNCDALRSEDEWHQLGLEALTTLLLTTTLVYLEFAPVLDWNHANFLP